MLRTKTALGIDISNNRISLALLRQDKNGVELLKTASGPVPDGAIKNGNIEDATVLAKAIKELKTGNKIRSYHTALSLVANPILIQILELPKQVPTNIGQFVQNEVKHCVVLSGKEIALDFCGVGSAGRPGSRLFVVATDGQKVAELAKVCSQAGLNVGAIEPPLLAYARAFYAKKIAGKFDCNVLMALLQGSTLTLCVFRGQTVDFVRTKNISKEKAKPDELCQRLAEEINTIIQFYNVEVPDSPGSWEITVVADGSQLPKDAEESLKAKVASTNLQVRTPENACQDITVGKSQYIGSDKLSPVAIGLAMKLLGTNDSNLRINLLPPEAGEVKALRKEALITANIAASLLLLMILAVGGLSVMTKKVNKRIIHKKQAQPLQDTNALLREQKLVEKQIKQLSGGPGQLNDILSLRHDVDWAHLLNDIRSATPKTARITELVSKGNSRMSLEGLALSYESVRLFVDMLNKSEHIVLASLVEAEKDSEEGGLVRYAINCSMTPREER